MFRFFDQTAFIFSQRQQFRSFFHKKQQIYCKLRSNYCIIDNMEKHEIKKGRLPIGLRIIGIILAALAAAYGLYAGIGDTAGNADGEMQIFALDVGQGDSFFLISPNGKTMLIDSGESSNSKQIEQFIRDKGVQKLDVVVGSHTHSDHVGSMPYLLDAFDVGEYVMSEAGLETRIQKRINAVLEEKQITRTYAWAGDSINWDDDCSVTVLSPVPEFDEYSKTDWNEWSLIIRVEYADHAMIFTGDATVRSEQAAMLNNEKQLFSADVLKVAHHGSTTSSSLGFLEAVNPEYAIISVGEGNSYGHPDYDTIQKLKSINAAVYRTDELGTITIVFGADGVQITH